MVRRENDRPETIGSRGGLGDAEFGTQRSAHARIVAGPEREAQRICATHRTPNDRAGRHLVTRSRPRRLTMGFTGPSDGAACVRVGNVPAAVSSLIALSAASSGLRRRRSAATVPTVPVLVLLAADLWADRLEALHGTKSRSGGVAINRHWR
jgi:hypothetical protein